MIIIAISGKKRSGKNTLAKLASTMIAGTVKEYAFAHALKEELASICKVPFSDIEERKDLYRHLLQAWGVYRRETKGHDYWIEKVLRRLQFETSDVVFITDLRFRNELMWMTKCGAVVVRVNRPAPSVDEHVSETELDNAEFDFVIENNGTLNSLASEVRTLLSKLNIKTK